MNGLGYNLARNFIFCVLLVVASFAMAAERSFVEGIDKGNVALIVGVSHGLPGLDIDVANMEEIATHTAYQLEPTILEDSEGTQNAVQSELSRLSQEAGKKGTLLFYYTGHGSSGSIYLQDGSLGVEKIRKAVEDPRLSINKPLERFVFIIDACYSGSLLDPMRYSPLSQLRDPAIRNMVFADELVRQLTSENSRGDASKYWKKLFVFASSRADETSLAGYDGSVFTNAFYKAFRKTEKEDGTMGRLVALTQKYTEGHHPVARMVPANLEDEKLVP